MSEASVDGTGQPETLRVADGVLPPPGARGDRVTGARTDGGVDRVAEPDWAALADAGWAAPSRETVFGWEARFASGVTKRANSAWARAGARRPPVVSAEAFSAIEAAYRARAIRPCFQLTPADEGARRLLIGRGYRAVDETLVLAASVPPSPLASGAVEIASTPSPEWLACWWAVDGRGGDAELGVARQIMTGTPSLYAALRIGARVVSVARLALVGGWGGVYCVATLPEHRRRGYSATVLESLLAAGSEHGVTDVWLQVLAGNSGALALYSGRFGFREVERYRYLLGPLRMPPAPGCR